MNIWENSPNNQQSLDGLEQQLNPEGQGEQYEAETATTTPKPPSQTDFVACWRGFAVSQYLRGQFQTGVEITLPELLFLCRNHTATDLPDKIFALLSLLPQTVQANSLLRPDYSITGREVFTRVAVYILQSSRTLDTFSCVCRASDETPYSGVKVPSWVPTWDDRVQDPLAPGIFRPMQPQIFNAGESNQFKPLKFSGNLKQVTCHAVIFDTVGFKDASETCDGNRLESKEYDWEMAFGPISEAVTALRKEFSDHLKKREACWRTIVANTGILRDGTRARLNPQSLISEISQGFESSPQQGRSAPLERFFVTKGGRIGRILGPGLLYGDIVTVLFGAQVPFILRRVRGAVSSLERGWLRVIKFEFIAKH